MSDFAPLSFSIGKGDWEMDPRFHDFCNFLGLAKRDAKGINWRVDEKTRAKLEDLYMWGSLKGKTEDHDKIKEQVHRLQQSVGVNWTGKTLIDRLWQHTTFDTGFKKAMAKYLADKKATKPAEKKKSDTPLRTDPAGAEPIKEVKPEPVKRPREIEIEERPRGQLKSEPLDL